MATTTHHRPSERGNAYLVAILVLLMLTILGFSLLLVTETEQEIGANERIVKRTFYAGDSGLAIAAARILANNDFRESTYELNDTIDDDPAPLLDNRVGVGPVVPLLEAPCNLCEINNSGTYNDTTFKRFNIAMNAEGRRVLDGPDEVISRSRLSAMLDVQPWKTDPSAYDVLLDYTADELDEKLGF